jgi:putative glutamine amidotransferase
MSRPLIAIPGRFAASTSALRFGAVVNARKLLDAVFAAGGEPVTVYPHAPGGHVSLEDAARRLEWADGLLLPGGGDLDPRRYGQDPESEHLYDIDAEQDAFDLAAAEWANAAGVPTLAICRGVQVVNTVRGGELDQHMDLPHRSVVQPVEVIHPMLRELLGTGSAQISCYHHQRIGRLGAGLEPAAVAADGTVEAAVDPHASGWFLGIQWHAEDTADTDPVQLGLFHALVEHAQAHRDRRPAH